LQLEIGVGVAARDALQKLLRARRAVLREHEQSPLLEPGRLRAFEQVLEDGESAVGIGLHQAVERQ